MLGYCSGCGSMTVLPWLFIKCHILKDTVLKMTGHARKKGVSSCSHAIYSFMQRNMFQAKSSHRTASSPPNQNLGTCEGGETERNKITVKEESKPKAFQRRWGRLEQGIHMGCCVIMEQWEMRQEKKIGSRL